MNLAIEAETEELFIAQVLENYFLNLVAEGISVGSMAEDVYTELQYEVNDMLVKKIYGHYNLDSFRAYMRQLERPDAA